MIHGRPSSVGIDTLNKSKLDRETADTFYRGCGVPDQIIDQLPALLGSLNPIDFYSCFISYSHADKSFARRLHDGLRDRGIRC